MDEVVLADKPILLHFDVEIKKADAEIVKYMDVEVLLKEHINGL